MSRHSDRIRVSHMLDHAREAAELVRGKTQRDLIEDRVLTLAVVRLLEVTGEAAARMREDTQQLHRDIPWPEIVGLRNRLIHGYDAVDMDILWQVLDRDLPRLIPQLEQMLDDERLV
ncbi:MAG: DUF86 domain-containing protein [Phycisphaerae bacterium]|nr:DUF86 domain-containing protein [Phycisphaerae bacterium]